MKKILCITAWVFLCLFLGYLSTLLQDDSIAVWYPTLMRSPLSPPAWLFPVAWSVLYILMGVSVGLMCGVRSIYTNILYIIFMIQLFFNVLWSFFFFYLQSPLLGFVDIIMLDLFVVVYFVGAYVVNRPSAWLFVPYMMWLAFATYLNGYIMLYN